jgi:PhnB protein
MKNNLLFNFIINKENNTVNVEREFAANLDRVWDAWTKPEILDQWWAPKPYKAVTKSMDFREGGMWFYYMLSPENQKHWCKNNYQKIQVKK